MELHPRHGPHDPASSTLPRRPGSARRTSNVDSHWSNGLDGDVRLVGSARDLVTASDGAALPAGVAELDVLVTYHEDRRVAAISSSPPAAGVQDLVGAPAAAGFRRRVGEVLPGHREDRSLLHLLLDDVPVTSLIAAYAFNAAGRALPAGQRPLSYVTNLCAGWAETGTMMVALRETGRSPRVTGPAAPRLERDDDPLAWHLLPPMRALTVRRRRRLDVWREGPLLACSAMFRDSYMHDDGTETIVHEYELTAELADLVVVRVQARPRVLPWQECPLAAQSAQQIIGQHASALRGFVRSALTGTSTCTHLNDLLRSLDDVVALERYL
jgi:hypothetical protein